MITLTITGIAVFLLLLGSAVPHLRGNVTLENDLEDPTGETVSIV